MRLRCAMLLLWLQGKYHHSGLLVCMCAFMEAAATHKAPFQDEHAHKQQDHEFDESTNKVLLACNKQLTTRAPSFKYAAAYTMMFIPPKSKISSDRGGTSGGGRGPLACQKFGW